MATKIPVAQIKERVKEGDLVRVTVFTGVIPSLQCSTLPQGYISDITTKDPGNIYAGHYSLGQDGVVLSMQDPKNRGPRGEISGAYFPFGTIHSFELFE